MTIAPSKTSNDLNFHNISTRCPNGIFNTQGRPAQKPNPAKNTADKSKYSFTKKTPTIFVMPETPAAK